ncbi:hypothetical protein KAFR_0A07200 [Kazachstania africana CBS 2517]|uniref:Uncharacterized protein n=1 Tax=Kazachstania africana (strain ATCC 22294 / BCRC 22015 / CBS 2517 / CECT 1963 / NBRC 1671 / NRRL Y-8276) TaxID=1071382 RepID=H2AP54_KAZAF|nr:hypothetical protein KAFR_0A07200 [Kazachstania africana CBS 2517]CCF56154.1 hypothetical protein KAFR_0A07200 [Kazachstania africana CBS 2517]
MMVDRYRRWAKALGQELLRYRKLVNQKIGAGLFRGVPAVGNVGKTGYKQQRLYPLLLSCSGRSSSFLSIRRVFDGPKCNLLSVLLQRATITPSNKSSVFDKLHRSRITECTNTAVKNIKKSLQSTNIKRSVSYEADLFKLMNEQRVTRGSYIDFELPSLSTPFGNVAFLSETSLSSWKYQLAKIDKIRKMVEQIFNTYGSLPVTKSNGNIRIHFTNSSAVETERLIADLGITEGIVFPDDYSEILSGYSSTENLQAYHFSPVLSECN